MTAADLSQFLTELDHASANSELNDMEVPSLAPDGVWSRTIPSECSGCWKAESTHKCMSNIGFGPVSAAKAILEKLIDPANDLRERTRLWRSLLQLMQLGAHGMLDTNDLVGMNNPVLTFSWPVASVSGSTIGLTWAAGTQDPRAVEWSILVEDPLYPSAGHESQYISETVRRALKARGKLTFGYPSLVRNFTHGWTVRRVYVPNPSSFTQGNTFYLILEDDDFDGSEVLTEYPESTGVTIEATYKLYSEGADETWARIRNCYPFWAIEKTQTISSPIQALYTIESSARIRKPDSGWFYAYDQAGNPLSLSSKIQIVQGSASWSTKLDLTSFDLTGITSILLVYWIWSTAAGAVNVGQDRCYHSHHDPTGSWGDADGNSDLHYCAKRNELRGTSYDTNYRAECYQIDCPYFTDDEPSDPLEAIEQLIYSYPWRREQVAVGYTETALYRHGVPSLMSITQTLREPPVGLYRRKLFTDQAGGWERYRVYNGQVRGDRGLEMIHNNNTDTAIDITASSSWPDFGPGGNRVDGRRTDYGSGAANDTNDPHRVERQTMVIGGLDLDPYNGTTSGTLGKRQRIGLRRYKAFLPGLGTGTPLTRDDGTVYRGFWDANLQPCAEAAAVWRARIVLAAPKWSAFGGVVKSATVALATYTGYGLRLELENGVLSAASPIEIAGEMIETTTSWRQGATNVASLEGWRVWNYACGQSVHGPMRGLIRTGHVVRFTGEDFAGYAIYGRALWVWKAEAFAGGTDSWKVDPLTAGTEAEYYDGNVAIHGAGLPQMHYNYANRRDVIEVMDSSGIVSDFINAEGIGPFIGAVLQASDDGVAMEGGSVYTSSRANPAPDVEESNARFLGAQGEIFLEQLATDDACVIPDAYFAERDGVASVNEAYAIDDAFAYVLGE